MTQQDTQPPAETLANLRKAAERKIGFTRRDSEDRVLVRRADLQWLLTRRAGGDAIHSDDHAVDLFAARMKAKLAAARAKGRGGWDDPARCSTDYLRDLLHDHVAKGDPIDVANFCMMLDHYGASTTPFNARADRAFAVRQQTIEACARIAFDMDDGLSTTHAKIGAAILKLPLDALDAPETGEAK